MKARWWSYVLGLFLMPTEVILNNWTVSQVPDSVSYMRVNSSAEITCTTSLSNPIGLYLRRYFHHDRDIVYLSLKEGKVTKNVIAPNYGGRVHMTPDKLTESKGSSFMLRLSLLELEDTDMYYCTWSHFSTQRSQEETKSSNGTIIIVTKEGPQEPCTDQILDLILISLSVTAFTAVLILLIGVLTVKCKRFKKTFRPARDVERRRPNSSPYICPECRPPYMTTSANPLDFRGIL
ncbi:hypothetical protein INR49_008023 [Caranx melampygus]|nr:hypothetical protein INR49_008023 [Caranx melampygus]